MATFHCAVKSGKSGTGVAHADYIEREGKYASKEKDDLEYKESGNMPEWAETSADFWAAADKHERANGAVYREFEVALPRELTKEQRLALVHEMVKNEIGGEHAYTFAIHNPKAAIEGGEQPHAHIMFSERIQDYIDRPKEQYFKRWNAKQPERGGCQKSNFAKTGEERREQLERFRERFAELQNKHLAKAGQDVRVTHLSLKAQGINRKPEKDYGIKPTRAEVKEIREIRGIRREIEHEVKQNTLQEAKIDRMTEAMPSLSPRLGLKEAVDAVHDVLHRNAVVNGKIALNGVYEAAAVARKWLEKETHPEKEMLNAFVNHWQTEMEKVVQQQAREQERAQPKPAQAQVVRR